MHKSMEGAKRVSQSLVKCFVKCFFTLKHLWSEDPKTPHHHKFRTFP